ncbi:hypothetical protein VTH06DRAFT_1620 [Thermothelomyces fergusii]
MSRAN